MNEEEKENVQESVQIKSKVKDIVHYLVHKRKGCFSQNEIARFIGVDRRKIIALEKGECDSIFLLDKYATILGEKLILFTQEK